MARATAGAVAAMAARATSAAVEVAGATQGQEALLEEKMGSRPDGAAPMLWLHLACRASSLTAVASEPVWPVR